MSLTPELAPSNEVFSAAGLLARASLVPKPAAPHPPANAVESALSRFHEAQIDSPLSAALGDFQVWSESGRLTKVIIGDPHPGVNYDPEKAPPIDGLTRETQRLGVIIPPEQAVAEFRELRRVLESFGVSVASPPPRAGEYNQIYTRDIAMILGDTLVPAKMRHEERTHEFAALARLIDQAAIDGRSIMTCHDPKATFEGGDILIHDGKLFVGLTDRTNAAGIAWLAKSFPHLDVVPMAMRRTSADQKALHHLDCAFAALGGPGNRTALIAPNSFTDLDLIRPCLNRWDLIEVTPHEQELLGTNVLAIDHQNVIIRDRCTRLIEELSRRGFNPIPLSFDAAASLGGLFRCCSFPISRDR